MVRPTQIKPQQNLAGGAIIWGEMIITFPRMIHSSGIIYQENSWESRITRGRETLVTLAG